MTLAQIARLFYTPTTFSYCKQRCRYLFDGGYLRKRRVNQNDPDIYYLGLQGRKHVASVSGWGRAEVDRLAGVSGSNRTTPALMMRHELTLSRLYVNARLECRAHGWSMQWKNTRMLEMERLGLEPDAWIGLSGRRGQREAYVEFTAAMPSHSEMAGKLSRYEDFWAARDKAVPVLWLSTSRGKANRLLEAIRRSEYRDCFLVGQIEDAGRWLTGTIWRWGDAEDGQQNDMVQWVQPPPNGG